jgi:pyridoxine 5-phosphate synthase
MTDLSVNIDHVATLRQARGTTYPDPVIAARRAEDAGATGITVHLRADRRHIQDSDVIALKEQVRGKLNLEMAVTEEMLGFALAVQPDQITLVPERPEEITTEGGLNLISHGDRIAQAADRLARSGIETSVFLDPDPAQIEALRQLGPSVVPGFEINTDRYSRSSGEEILSEIANVQKVASLGSTYGFRVFAGHGLTMENVGPISAMPEIEELNIGHAIISQAVLVGIETAVGQMLSAMRNRP